jgi:hypothetical protein
MPKHREWYNIQVVPKLLKSSITCLLLKISTFFFFLDDSYASTACSENIAVYTYTECPNIIKNTKVMFF